MNDYNRSAELWNDFKKALISVLTTLEFDQLKRLDIYDDRKHVFNKEILPRVADVLNYELKSEFLRIDYAFRSKSRWPVPLIFIESENNWNSCYEEALKLCSANAPLKILIAYSSNKAKKELESEETNDFYILDDFIRESVLVGWYVTLLYEKIEKAIRFHVYAYDDKGAFIESIKVPFDIPVNF